MAGYAAPTDYDAESKDIERRRKYAEALQAQSMQPLETQMAGGWAIPISPTQGLAKALQAYKAKEGMDKAKADQLALTQRVRSDFSNWAGQMPQATEAPMKGSDSDMMQFNIPAQMESRAPTKQQMLSWALQGASSGNPLAAQLASPIMVQALKQEDAYTLPEGAQRRGPDGKIIAENPKDFRPQPAAPVKPIIEHNFSVGDNLVQPHISLDGGVTWQPVAGSKPSAKFAKQVAPTFTQEAPVTPVTVQDPKNPNETIVIDGRSGRVLGKGAKLTETGKANFKQQSTMQGLGSDLQAAEDLLMGNKRDSEGNVTSGTLPTGSGIGSLVDKAAGLVGITPKGAAEADELKVVSGRLVQKVPRFEGPQSDKDVALYKQMAADAGNESLTRERRLAAIRRMRSIYTGYESGERGRLVQSQIAAQPASGGATGGWSIKPVP